MTFALLKASQPSGDCYWPFLAPAPSTDLFAAAAPGSDGTAFIARITDAGVVVWEKTIAPGAPSTHQVYGTNGSRFVVAYAYQAPTLWEQIIICFDADGTELWAVSSGDFHIRTLENNYPGRMLEVNAAGDVFLIGQNQSNNNRMLIKLNAADGSVAWANSIVDTGLSSFFTGAHCSGIFELSGGDIVLGFYGPTNAGSSSRAYVGRFSGTDGSLVWSQRVAVPSATTSTMFTVAVDPSDRIYVARGSLSAADQVAVACLDSDGVLSWSTNYDLPGNVFVGYNLAATSQGVYVPLTAIEIAATQRAGALFVDFNGANQTAFSYALASGSGDWTAGAYADGTDVLLAVNQYAVDFSVWSMFVRDSKDYADGTFNEGVDRTTHSVTTTTGQISIASYSPTVKADFAAATSPVSSGAVSGADWVFASLMTEPTVAEASSVAPATTFGLPTRGGVKLATSVEPTTTFGLPAFPTLYDVQATAVEPATTFGTPLSFTSFASKRVAAAISLEPATRFGSASATAARTASAIEPTTNFGEPRLSMGFGADEIAPTTNFGTAALRLPFFAAALAPATLFGTPAAGVVSAAGGFSKTRFGTPSVQLSITCLASGWLSTNFGGPDGDAIVTRMRGQLFRTRFGLPQAERTAP